MQKEVIFKYEIVPRAGDTTELSLPEGAKYRHVAMQGHMICLWVQFNPTAPRQIEHVFKIVGTGHPIDPAWEYVGTVHDLPFVWHPYEAVK